MTHSHRVVVWYSNDARVAYCDEPACSGYRHEAKAGVCWPVGANPKLNAPKTTEERAAKTCARCGTVFRDGELEVVMKNHRQICRLNEDAKHVFETIEKWGTAHEAVATGIRDVIAEAFPKPEACPRCAVKPDGVHSICSAHRPKAAKVMCNECGEVEKMIDDPRCMVCAFVTDPANNAK